MSQENVEIVRRVIHAWNRDQQERVIRYLDPNVVFDATRRVVNPKSYKGMEGMRAMLADRDEVWEDFRTEPDEFVDAGDRIVVVSTQHAVPKGGQQQMKVQVVEVWAIRDGLLAERRSYSTKDEALEAAGLSE